MPTAPRAAAQPPAGKSQSQSSAAPTSDGRFDANAAAHIARYFDADTADYLDDVPTLQAYARRTGGPVLELGCGTGRLLVRLARAGYAVTGVDLSPAMLDIVQAKARKARVSERVTLIEGDYISVSLPDSYHLAFIVMNTFMHLLTQEEQLRALRHWRAALAPEGLLLIDVFQPDVTELAGLQGHIEIDKSWVDPSTGATVMKQIIRTVDQTEQIVHTMLIYDEVTTDGSLQRTLVPFDLRYMWRFEAELLLDKAGFVLEGIYGDWDLGPLESASERMILVARRQD